MDEVPPKASDNGNIPPRACDLSGGNAARGANDDNGAKVDIGAEKARDVVWAIGEPTRATIGAATSAKRDVGATSVSATGTIAGRGAISTGDTASRGAISTGGSAGKGATAAKEDNGESAGKGATNGATPAKGDSAGKGATPAKEDNGKSAGKGATPAGGGGSISIAGTSDCRSCCRDGIFANEGGIIGCLN